MSLAQVAGTSVTSAPTAAPATPPKDEAAMRRMAAEFEALLLNQLTASLNPKDENEDEGGLFTNSGGLGLSKQMFSEQLAKTMSQNGGVGLSKLILSQVGQKAGVKMSTDHVRALAAAREIRTALRPAKTAPTESLTKSLTKSPTKSTSASTDKYPDAIIISEAASGNVTATSADAAHATRPRRVHPIATDSSITTARATPSASPISTATTASARVALHLPLRGAIRSGFGPRRDPINGKHRFHQGLDIAAPSGTPIEAAAAGTVVFAGRNKGYGNMVTIEHADGRRTIYAHAKRLSVKVGDTVSAGQTIAAVGSTGHSTGPHLHFEVREGKQPLNPLTVLANDFTLVRR